jgi:hypothetical protein
VSLGAVFEVAEDRPLRKRVKNQHDKTEGPRSRRPSLGGGKFHGPY